MREREDERQDERQVREREKKIGYEVKGERERG